MSSTDFVKWMIEQGLSSRFDRAKCLETLNEEGLQEAKQQAIAIVIANKPKPHTCPLTGITI